jgi:hypothetical protein
MRLKDKIIKDIDQMEPDLLPMVYDYITVLKQTIGKKVKTVKPEIVSHKDVQKELSSSKTIWSDDLSQEREERI